MKTATIVPLIATAALGVLIFLGTRHRETAETPPAVASLATPAHPVGPAPVIGRSPATAQSALGRKPSARSETTAVDRRIDALLADPAIDESQAASRLLELAGKTAAPIEPRIAALEHGLNLLADEHYEEVQPLIEDEATPPAILSSLMFDLYQRSEEVKLPVALSLLRRAGHPLKDDAHELLAFVLGEDFGEDWNLWATALANYLEPRG